MRTRLIPVLMFVGVCWGVLAAATVSGVVTAGDEEAAVDGAVVELRTAGGRGQAIGTDTTGSDGEFLFEEVDTGRYTVRVSRNDGRNALVATMAVYR